MRLKHWFYTVPLRLRSLFRRAQVEQELDAELRYHIERQIEEHISKGMTEEEARYTALRAMGGVERRKEECRDMRRVRLIEDLMQDVHYSLRTLRRNPGFTAVATVTLALGIGVNTAIFSVIDALMLKRLPVRNPEQLVRFEAHSINYHANGVAIPGTGYDFPHPTFERFRTLTNFFSDVSGITEMDHFNMMTDGPDGSIDNGQVVVGMASGNYFSNLGVQAALGRTFTSDDDRTPGGHPVAVISYSYWERRFARAADVVGRTFTLNSTKYDIIGVTAKGFSGDWVGKPVDFWVTFMMASQVMPEVPGGASKISGARHRTSETWCEKGAGPGGCATFAAADSVGSFSQPITCKTPKHREPSH